MEGEEGRVKLACLVSAVLFSVLSSLSFSILWAVHWHPWRIYKCIFFFFRLVSLAIFLLWLYFRNDIA